MSDLDVQRLLDDVAAQSDGLLAALRPGDVEPSGGVDQLARVAALPERLVDSVAVNGSRVDVVVVATGAEWRIVLEAKDARVSSVVVFERPGVFAGVSGGRAVVVNGPSSAGKSTVMSAVLASSKTPWVMFDELFFGTVAMSFLIWGDTAPTLRPGYLAGIEALAAAGNQVITTGGHPREFEQLRAHVPTLAVGLDCPLNVRLARQEARSDRWGGLTEATDDRHEGWAYDMRFDTSRLDPAEVAGRILRAVDDL